MSLSNIISKKISNELKLDKDKSEIISYGAFAFFQLILTWILLVLFGFIFGVLFEAIIFSFTSSTLRKYSGGVHASRPSICVIIGTSVTIGMAVLSHNISIYFDGLSIILSGIACFAWSYYIIIKYAPVDSKNKPIKTKEKRDRMKKMSIIILSLCVLVSIYLIGGFYLTKNILYLKYSICINSSVIWQVFNLTIIGHKILNKIDSFLSKVLFSKKGGNLI